MNAFKPQISFRGLAAPVLALIGNFSASGELQGQQPGQYLASSSPYGQWQPPATYRPQPEVYYYQPGEYLPLPGAASQAAPNPQAAATKPPPAAAPQPYQTPQAPYAYPPNLKKQAAEQVPAQPPAPQNAPQKPMNNAPEDIEALKRENYFLNQRLAAMQSPGAGPQSVPVPGRIACIKHTVRHGDSLWGLALRYRTTVSAIREFNALGRKDKLIEGREIAIPVRDRELEKAQSALYMPPAPPAPTQQAPKAAQPAANWGKHIVKPNETLSLIAQHYNVSTRSMQVANGLKSVNRIYVGQELVIPGKSASEVAEAAKKPVPVAPAPAYPGATTKEPKAKTTTTSQGISNAYIPAAPPASRAPTTTSASRSVNRGITSYRIKKQDTIESISKSYNLSASEIATFNRLPGNKLPPAGEEILLPTPVIVSL